MVSIIDVQQILMQEPRASWKGAQLIAHSEFQQELMRQKRVEEQRRKQVMVQKMNGISAKRPISNKTTVKKDIGNSAGRGRSRHIDFKV